MMHPLRIQVITFTILLQFHSIWLLFFFFWGGVLRDPVWTVGTQRPTNQGPSHVLHPMPFWQFDGRRRHLFIANMRHSIAPQHGSSHYFRKVIRIFSFVRLFLFPNNFGFNLSLPNLKNRFHAMELLSLNPRLKSSFLEGEQESTMLESCLTFLASLMSVRTNIGTSIWILFFFFSSEQIN